MSLAPALQRIDSDQETTQSSKRVSSVYQQDGQPLSKEALYRYKKKYNSFSIGNSQDDEQEIKANRARSGSIAAKLAVKNVSVKQANAALEEAHKASPEEQYKRLLVQADAPLLAAHKSATAKKVSPSIESRNNSTLFSQEKLASAANQASKNKEYVVDSEGHLDTSSASKKKIDLSRLKNVATDDYAESQQTNKKFNLAKLIPQATKNAETMKSKSTGSKVPIPIQNLNTKKENEAFTQSKYEIDSLTQLASKLADERIKDSVDTVNNSKRGEKALFTNEEWNKLAVKAVMERKQEILDDLKSKQSAYEQKVDPKSVKVGDTGRIYKLGDIGAKQSPDSLIVLGSGLTLTQGEVTKLANKLMLPLITQIDSDTKRQLIKQAKIDEDNQTFKVENLQFKEESRTQQKREKGRETYEKKIQRQEDKIVSKNEKLEQKGFKVDMSDVLLKIQEHNNEIKSNLQKQDVIAIDQVKQKTTISELETGIEEVQQKLTSLKEEVAEIEKANEASDISPKDVRKNKYALQTLSTLILQNESKEAGLLAALSLEKSRKEDLSQKLILLETSNDQLQSSIDINLDKFEHLQGLGKADKEKSAILNNLRRENQINLRSKAVFIRSSFNKNLDDIIAKVKAEDEADLAKAEDDSLNLAAARKEHKTMYDTVNDEIKERKEYKPATNEVAELTEEVPEEAEEVADDVESELKPPQQKDNLKEVLN